MKKIISKLTAPLKILAKNPGILILCTILDAIFFILYGFLTSPFFKSMTNLLVVISDKVSLELDLVQQGLSSAGGMLDIIFGVTIRADVLEFIIMGLIVSLVIYVLYSVVHGTCWKYATRLAGYSDKHFLRKFFFVNIFWMVLLVLHSILDVLQELRYLIMQRITGGGINFPRYFMILLLFIGAYFALISYKTKNIKKSFREGVQTKKHIGKYLLILLLFLIINFILQFAGYLHENLLFLLGIILFLPAISYFRIFFLMGEKDKLKEVHPNTPHKKHH